MRLAGMARFCYSGEKGGIRLKLRMFWHRMRPLSQFVLTRGVLLSCGLLASALVMLVWADSAPGTVYLLEDCASYTVDMAAIVMGAGLIGSLLLEDVLVHNQ